MEAHVPLQIDFQEQIYQKYDSIHDISSASFG